MPGTGRMIEIRIIIPLEPRTKKNGMRILRSRKTGKPFNVPSKEYADYLDQALMILSAARARNGIRKPIEKPVNVKAVYFMATRQIVDITNLHEGLHDALVDAGILQDDNSRIVYSTDGSRVRYDKWNPRTEVMITEITDEEELKEWERMIPRERGRKTD